MHLSTPLPSGESTLPEPQRGRRGVVRCSAEPPGDVVSSCGAGMASAVLSRPTPFSLVGYRSELALRTLAASAAVVVARLGLPTCACRRRADATLEVATARRCVGRGCMCPPAQSSLHRPARRLGQLALVPAAVVLTAFRLSSAPRPPSLSKAVSSSRRSISESMSSAATATATAGRSW